MIARTVLRRHGLIPPSSAANSDSGVQSANTASSRFSTSATFVMTHQHTSRDARERAYSALGVGGGSGGLFSTADAGSELFDANACSSWSALCFLTSFSTARVHLVFTPMNNSRRSMRLQAEHKNVWCSNPGSVVGSAGTASIKSISALHAKHRIAVSPSPMGAWCRRCGR